MAPAQLNRWVSGDTGAQAAQREMTDRGIHPIGMVYDSALAAARSDLRDPALAASGLGGTIESDMLFEGRLECASCHGLHGESGQPFALIKSNHGSGLCLTCHDK